MQHSTKKTTLRAPEEVRRELALRGLSVSDWARQVGYSPNLVHQVLSGRLLCIRGKAHRIAVMLGLKEGLLEDVADLPFGKKCYSEAIALRIRLNVKGVIPKKEAI